ncbi:GAF domain-containing sensor histidine kinase [Natrialba sp. INN-245]|uniref:GAF domain-containing sensor histidine kinase n=1 Tax=Natrialba sp. INN-245 TaxID=2690967 RepID=UPI001311A4C8|nr:GAF domain-containing sensor histidine kinase [Natrialba sp. INN-245]MWV40546.1 GAF domain-containing protein [Natrialba sp. INN-245]
MNYESQRESHGGGPVETRCPRRRFHVVYLGTRETDRERVSEELEPIYKLRTVDSASAARDALDEEIDCLIVGPDLTDEETIDVIEGVRGSTTDVSVVVITPSADPAMLRALLEVDTAELVDVRDEEGITDHDVERLRTHVDEYYHRSISDIRETVFDISRSLMGAAPDETDIEIEWGLRLVGEQLDADRCLLFEYAEDVLDPTHVWDRRSNSPAEADPVSPSAFPGFDTLSKSFDPYAVPADVDDLEFDVPEGFVGDIGTPADRDDTSTADADSHRYLAERTLESLLAVPIVVDWELIGILVVEQETRRLWPRSLRQQIQTFGELVGYTLDRERRRRELARQNERLERFVSVVSHDLRNPLNVLSGYIELIEETGDPEHIEDVSVAADRMETMIEDLLTLARQGETLEKRQPVDLEDVARRAWNAVDTADARLVTRELGTVDSDPGRLQQAFENLFRNAIEHAGARVTVTVVGTEDGFAVEDDGPGIPADQRDCIFREGYTGGDGTGLGLSIVATVVDAHGWSISVEESDDGGARFAFTTADDSNSRGCARPS